MKQSAFFALALTGALAFGPSLASAQVKADPWAGTWKMDLAKSKLHGPAPKEETVTSEGIGAKGDIVKFSISAINAEGQPVQESYDGKADGKMYPFIANGQEVAKTSYRRVSAREFRSRGAGADGSTTYGTVTLSKDGKTITIHQHGKSKQGAYTETVVYRKQ